ncbi:MAG: alpha-2-macroglobulin family protein [Pseudorhodoplanes sp.]|nr:alpha-2-macroglobulin family protein [Pseudorhodoplanes sp.]
MLAAFRAGLVAALVCVALSAAHSAEKAFQRDDLADAAIRLEAQIKTDSGPVTKPIAQLRREADTAFQKNDFGEGLKLLGQIAVVSPQDAGNWLRIARAVLQLRPTGDRERTLLQERASTAAYIAYRRATDRIAEAEALVVLGNTFAERKLWRPALDVLRLSLDQREVAEVRAQYEKLRSDHGFRLLDYTVDSDAAAPRACFQFSEMLAGQRTDYSPFIAVGGQDKPALSSEEKQLCVEGLKHGERYAITLRAGIPSAVKETLAKSASFNIYVRDRKPFVRFAAKAYVLPRTGQKGIPVVTVNTPAVSVEVLRIGDRNLLNTVLGSDFQTNLYSYDLERLRTENAIPVWKGELAVEQTLNADVTTAFPVDQAIGDLAPGVYVMIAQPMGPKAGGGNDDDYYGSVATQWFIVSDLGLSAFSGHDGIHAFVNSLASAQPKAGMDVQLISRANEILAVRKTDASGRASFEANLARGEGGSAPAMLVAAEPKGDYAFLSLKSPAFDLSDRGVIGRQTPAGLDAFVYSERGVYRPGETVHLTAMLRDARGVAVSGSPLTLVVDRPDGVEYRRVLLQDQGLGGRSLSMPVTPSSPTGTYRVRAYTDPKGEAVGQTSFMVEDYVADRLEFDLTSTTAQMERGKPAEIKVDGRFLYGAPAAGLDLEGETLVQRAKERRGYPGYKFGVGTDGDESVEREPVEDMPQTDDKGRATFSVTLDKLPDTSVPLEATIFVRMAESGGRAVERKLTLPIAPAGNQIGVKPLFSGQSLGENDNANFDVVFVQPDGKALARAGLRYELLKVETRYQWYRQGGSWNYEPVKSTRRMANGTLDVAADNPGRLSLPVTWGRYRLDLTADDPGIPTTSISFDSGFYAEASADTPDVLEIALDKGEYRAGDSINVAVNARVAGRVSLDVIGDKLLSSTAIDVQPGTSNLKLAVGQDWGSGAYVVATLRRPLDAAAQRMPGRAIGVQWFSIDRKARALTLDLGLPTLLRPNSRLNVPIKLAGLNSGEEARVVVAAVDVGILNLTNYKPPAPGDYYFGQRQLTAEIRDLYGQLIDGMQGTRGQIRTGGDSAGAELQGSPPVQKPLALYSGIVPVKSDGTADVAFDIPAFAGTVRVMAIAWSRDKVGNAAGDVTVRDPVVLTATLPRFLRNGDRGTVHLELDNVDGAAGDYAISVKADGAIGASTNAQRRLPLRAKQRDSISLPLAADKAGAGTVVVNVSGPDGFALERAYALDVRPATQIATRRTVRTIGKGESVTLSTDLFSDFVPGSGSLALSAGPSTALDAATLLKALDRYPFGCSEQITSRALPLLYVNELASAAQLAYDEAVDQRIRDAIDRLLARQGSDGSFGLWSAGGDDAWLDSYVTDFLTRARERGFVIPDIAFRQALDRLRNFVGTAPEPNKDGGRNLAYALYVLARNGAAPLGDLRYIADAKLADLATPVAKAQIAAALGLVGDRVRAERVYAAALAAISPQPALEIGRTDYGSALRDAAAFVTLASEGNAPRPSITIAVQRIEAARALSAYTSTQENAWLVLAARSIAKDTGSVSLDINGEASQKPVYRSADADALRVAPLKVTNNGEGPVQAVVSVSGAPLVPEPATERGFRITRTYHTLTGEPVDIARVKQNQRVVVVLTMTEMQPQFGRIIVADYLPAGLEIDNPRIVSSGETGTLDWIADAEEPVHSEFRDDRFTAAFERESKDQAVFSVAYVARAVSPGKYVQPQAFVEDMYRPDRFGRTGTGTIEVTAAR